MSLYLMQIKQLVELQKVDDHIFTLNTEIQNAPHELESLESRFAEIDEYRNKILEKITHIQDQQKRISSEIDEDTLRIKKSKNKLMQVANQREYHAMMREMDNIEKQNRTREEEKIALSDELQIQDEALANIDRDYLGLKAELDVKRDGLQERISKAEEKLAALKDVRANTGSEVPTPVFQRYEFIRERLDHPVIVPVHDGVCSGCHIAIPPQAFIELQRGQQILSCTNCQRLIYWSEHFYSPEETVQTPVQAAPAPIKTFLND